MKEGFTFDDVLLQPQFSNITSRKDVSTKTKLTKNISLNIPLVSANMDTITESKMAISMAELGGIGIIHRYLTIEQQVAEVLKVKRNHNFIIEDPYTISNLQSVSDCENLMRQKEVHCIIVLDHYTYKVVGIITNHDLLFKDTYSTIESLMTPISKMVWHPVVNATDLSFELAKEILKENKIEKLPLLDPNMRLKGLVTVKDIQKNYRYPNAVKDSKGRLLVGAAIGVKNDYLERAEALVGAGVDVLVIDIAHGHSQLLIDTLMTLKATFPNVDVIAGNVATKQGAIDLINAGADAIKVGVGSGCFASGTRVLMANGLYRDIDKLKKGDRVINMHGKPVRVLSAFSTGIKQVINIKTNSFYSDTVVTPEHQYWVQNGGTDTWCSVGDSDTTLFPKDLFLDISDSTQVNIKDIGIIDTSYDYGYIVGSFLANHTKNMRTKAKGSLVWNYSFDDLDKLNKLKDAIQKVFKRDSIFKKTTTNLTLTLQYVSLFRHLNRIKYCMNMSENFVDILNSNKDYTQGLLDGISGIRNPEELTKKVQEIKLIATYLKTGAMFNATGTSGNYFTSKIESKIPQNPQLVYDITVDCDTHSFIANNAIVHNSICSTRIVSGSGVPQLTAIEDCCSYATYMDVPVISDGGTKYSGDIVKALGAGASSVMLGSMLSGCEETTGVTKVKDGQKVKIYRGMASFDAVSNRKSVEKGYDLNMDDYVPEGVDTTVPYKGKLLEVITQLVGGVRSGMSYLGVHTIEDMPKNTEFIKISSAGWSESKPHILK